MENDLGIRPLNLWEKLFWNIFPNRCVLCGKWKLWEKIRIRLVQITRQQGDSGFGLSNTSDGHFIA